MAGTGVQLCYLTRLTTLDHQSLVFQQAGGCTGEGVRWQRKLRRS